MNHINNKKIKSLLIKTLNLKQAYITGDHNHIQIIVIGDIFKGMSPVKRQQTVYIPLINMIAEKTIHAVTITSYTIKEWEKNDKNISDIHNQK